MNQGLSALLWRHRALVATLALLGAIVGAVAARLGSPLFESTVVLNVVEPRIGEGRTAQVAAASYLPLVQSLGLSQALVKEFQLGAAPYGITPGALLRERLTADVLNPTSVLRLRVRLPDPELAAKVANRAAALAVEDTERLSREHAVRTRDEIGQHLTEARVRLDETGAALETYRREAQVELLRSDVQAALDERKQITRLTAEIAAERARMERTSQELQARTRTDTLRRSIDRDPALMEAARAGSPGSGSPLTLSMNEQRMNPVYETLDEQLAKSRSTLDGLERQRGTLVGTLKLGAAQWDRLSRLYAAEARLATLELEADVARKTYTEIATRHEQARLDVVSRSAQLAVLVPAAIPDAPLARGTLRTLLLGLILGVLAGVALAFAAEALAGGTREAGVPADARLG